MSFLLRSYRITQPAFEERLRRVYSDTVAEGVPDWAKRLLERLP